VKYVPRSIPRIGCRLRRDLKRYRVSSVRGDHYGGEWPAERFREHEILYLVADKTKSDYYLEFLAALNGRDVRYLITSA